MLVMPPQSSLALVACQDVTCLCLIPGETEAAAGEEPGPAGAASPERPPARQPRLL